MEAPVQMTSEPLSKERHMEAKDYLAYIVNYPDLSWRFEVGACNCPVV